MDAQIPNLGEDYQKLSSDGKMNKGLVVFLSLAMVVLGIGSGYFLSNRKEASSSLGTNGKINASDIVKGKEFGSNDTANFKDIATGVLEVGGIDGEGTHHLVREGGPTQTVYLMSSGLDLDQFQGRKVQVWGKTMKAQKAGWFMDVGRVKILE